MKAYPLLFTPILKERIWGGTRLASLGKNLGPMTNCGESWELSAVSGDISTIANGHYAGLTLTEAIERFGSELVGHDVYEKFGTNFPLLIKFIDACDDLSVQVHPGDVLESRKHRSFGKTEMWYVLAADEGAKLISGFETKIRREDYGPLLAKGEFLPVLRQNVVRAGDVIFVPAGRIHAIGRGVVVAEIQQTSDVTYRVFDYNRRDAQGRERQLHVADAEEAIDFDDLSAGFCHYDVKPNNRAEIVNSKYFNTGIIEVQNDFVRDYSGERNCVILVCVSGSVSVDNVVLECGTTALLPAKIDSAHFSGKGRVLEVFIP